MWQHLNCAVFHPFSHVHTLTHISLKPFFKNQVKKPHTSHQIFVPPQPPVFLNLLWTCCTISNINTQTSIHNKVKLNNNNNNKNYGGRKPGESQRDVAPLSTQHSASLSCCVRLQWPQNRIRRLSLWSSHQVLIHSQLSAPEATYLKWKSQRSSFPTAD